MTVTFGALSLDAPSKFKPSLVVLQAPPESDGIAPTFTLAWQPHSGTPPDPDEILGEQLNQAQAALPRVEVDLRTRVRIGSASSPLAEFSFDGPAGRMKQLIAVQPGKTGVVTCSASGSASTWAKHRATFVSMIESARGPE